MNTPSTSTPLLNPTPEDWQRLLERAAIVSRTRALEESIRRAQENGASTEAPEHPSSNGAEIASQPNHA